MRVRFSDLWRLSGTIDRGPYALVGAIGFALKHNLDRLLATYGFHREWGVFNYWIPLRDVAKITDLRSADALFLGTMVLLALPFIWAGVAMTTKRLRSAALPTQLVALFFVPFLNLLFLLVLCVLPARDRTSENEKATNSFLTRFVPETALGSASLSLLCTVPVGVGLTILGAQVFTNYGWGIFVALPFTMGFAAAGIYGARQSRSFRSCLLVACLAVALLGAALLAFAVEGIVCLVMAAPIVLPLAAFGGICAYGLQRRRPFRDQAPVALSALLFFVPGVQWTEHLVAAPSPIFVVRSAIEIRASPEAVWKQMIAFSEIPAPTEWMFKAGIAYPIRAEIYGKGPGAERHCVFSTGAFVEPIQVWDEPRLLKFSVTSNPAPMQEWTPYSDIDPPHLHGFLVSQGGQFLLTPRPNGGTRLEGTTWYRHGLWPASYWRLWSDPIIHRIHMRVLTHIRDEVESQSRE